MKDRRLVVWTEDYNGHRNIGDKVVYDDTVLRVKELEYDFGSDKVTVTAVEDLEFKYRCNAAI